MEKEQFIKFYTSAIRLAIIAHYGQKDISCEAYILHPLTVADKCKTDKAKIVAILHDVVEDSDFSLEDVRKEIPDDAIIHALDLVTKKKEDRHGQGYKCYLCRIKGDAIACEVKLADLQHNMDLSRLKEVTQRDLDRQAKYQKSFDYLSGKSYEYII